MKTFGIFGPLLVRVFIGWVTGAAPDVQEKDGEKYHLCSALNLSLLLRVLIDQNFCGIGLEHRALQSPGEGQMFDNKTQ